jgi:hypothetical protein
MGPREAPGPDSLWGILARRLPWLPAKPEAAGGRPMREGHGGLRAPSVAPVSPWWIPGFECDLG